MSGRLIVGLLLAAVAGVGLAVWLLLPRAGEAGTGSVVRGSLRSEAPPQLVLPRRDEPTAETLAAIDAASPAPAGVVAQATDAPLLLEVLHAHGAPAAGAMLVLATGERVNAALRLDATGKAELVAPDGATDVWIGGATLVPYRTSLPSDSGHHVIHLPQGEIISGLVRLDGAPPPMPFPIALNRLSGKPPVEKPDIPGAVQSGFRFVLPGTGSGLVGEAQLTDASGSFLFSGVPSGWTGEIQPPRAFRLRDREPGSELLATAPAVDVLVDLVSFPAVRGRVLASGTLAPAAARIDYEWRGENGLGEGAWLDCGADGRFEMPLRVGALKSIEMTITDPVTAGRAVLERAHIPAEGVDLGDIVLDATRDVELVVLDALGQPIAGAMAVLLDPESGKRDGQRSTRSDAEGRSVLDDITLLEASVEVWAKRCEPAGLALPADETGPFEVVLQPASCLDVHVEVPEGASLGGLWVRVQADETLFHGADLFPPPDISRAVGTTGTGHTTMRITEVDGRQIVGGFTNFGIGEDGWTHLPPVRPGVPFLVSVVDAPGFIIWGEAAVTLQQGEQREIHAVITRLPTAVDVLVLDARGAPVADAEVSLADSKAEDPCDLLWEYTGPEGLAHFPRVWSERVDVTAEKPSYAKAHREHVPVEVGGSPVDLILSPGREVRVCIEDELGRPLNGGALSASVGGRAVGALEPRLIAAPAAPADCQLLVGLPEGDIVLVYQVAGRTFQQLHHTSDPNALFVLPATGALVARWPKVEEPLQSLSLLVKSRVTGPDTSAFSQVVRPTSATDATLSLFPGEYDMKLTGQRGFMDGVVLSESVAFAITANATVEVVLER